MIMEESKESSSLSETPKSRAADKLRERAATVVSKGAKQNRKGGDKMTCSKNEEFDVTPPTDSDDP